MGFSTYFLIVADFVRFARENSIPVGPGRGSAAGSLVAYSLGITDLDPIDHGLIFERFLNVERLSLPETSTLIFA
jgi:DNA polymerase-3 subunit alpha